MIKTTPGGLPVRRPDTTPATRSSQVGRAPHETVQDLLDGLPHFAALHAFAVLGLADLLDQPMDVQDLAEQCDAHPDLLRRVLRDLTSVGIVRSDEPGCFTLTDAGATLRSDILGSMLPAVITAARPAWLGAIPQLPNVLRRGRPILPDDHASLYEYLRAHPDEQADFDEFMRARSYRIARGIAAQNFEHVRTIVDVGGGVGTVAAEVLATHPHCSAIVLDTPEVADRAQVNMEKEGLAQRCWVVGGDFFTSIPVATTGDTTVYLLANILHNWGNEDAVRILTQVRTAMLATMSATGGTTQLWIADIVLSAGDGPHPGTAADMRMMMMFPQGGERTLGECVALLDLAGFAMEWMKPLPLSGGLNLLVATLK